MCYSLVSIYRFLGIFFAQQIIFQRLLIFENHLVGEDFYFFVPNLVFGKLWFLKNGLWIPPDFAAHQCGIIPFHADPNSAYYSLIQLSLKLTSIAPKLSRKAAASLTPKRRDQTNTFTMARKYTLHNVSQRLVKL